MPNLDDLLYKWIVQANTRRDDLDLPVGVIEENIALLKQVLGAEYLEQILMTDSEPIHFLDEDANPLRKWLLSARVDTHIVQLLELAAYFAVFQGDPCLSDKVLKLKRDRFWPVFFELAMAARIKRACRDPQTVRLNSESPDSIGDFTLGIAGYEIPCECSRLGHSPHITGPRALEEGLHHRVSEATGRMAVPLCIKIRSTESLTGATYNLVLRLLRRGLAAARASNLPSNHSEGSTSVIIEELSATSEQMPFKVVDGKIVNVTGADWDSATRRLQVPARDFAEIEDRFDRGERFHEHEAVRLFLKFGRPTNQPDHYKRLTEKLKKKLKQTKTSAGHFGKVVIIEVPFDLRKVDPNKLKEAVREAAIHSRATLGVVLAHRESGPHFRFYYSQSNTFNLTAALLKPEIVELFKRFSDGEILIDPILASPYLRSWEEAQARASKIAEAFPEPEAATGG